MGRASPMPPEEKFSRTFFGVVLIICAVFNWNWIVIILGILFLVSAWQGTCFTCELYKRFVKKTKAA